MVFKLGEVLFSWTELLYNNSVAPARQLQLKGCPYLHILWICLVWYILLWCAALVIWF